MLLFRTSLVLFAAGSQVVSALNVLSDRREAFRQFVAAAAASASSSCTWSAPQAAVAATQQQGLLPTARTSLDIVQLQQEAADVQRTVSSSSSSSSSSDPSNSQQPPDAEIIRVPLKYVPSLSAYIVKYSVAGERFGAIIDTGSPFLVVPSYCDKQRWGCYRPEDSQPSGLEPTLTFYDNNQGMVEWRRAPFSFVDATGSMMMRTNLFTFGVLSESLMDGPGGVFLGLIRDTDARIRPSFLGQTPVRSFQIDLLMDGQKSLILSTGTGASLRRLVAAAANGAENDDDTKDNDVTQKNDDYIPLVRDLNRRYQDPAYHYTAKATCIRANGRRLLTKSRYPIYVIFDSGVSGMVVSSDISDERYATARANREKSLWGSVEIDLRTKAGNVVTLTAHKPVTTPFGERPWPQFKNAHLIVVGLAFLDGHQMTIDIDQQQLWLD